MFCYIEPRNMLITSYVWKDSCNDVTIESAQIKWEICKIEIKSKTIEFAKLKSRERHNKLNQLEKKWQHLHSLPNDSINHITTK